MSTKAFLVLTTTWLVFLVTQRSLVPRSQILGATYGNPSPATCHRADPEKPQETHLFQLPEIAFSFATFLVKFSNRFEETKVVTTGRSNQLLLKIEPHDPALKKILLIYKMVILMVSRKANQHFTNLSLSAIFFSIQGFMTNGYDTCQMMQIITT